MSPKPRSIDVPGVVQSFFDDSSRSGSDPPTCVILMGPVAAGKTTVRKEAFAESSVVVDAAEIFHRLGGRSAFDFPTAFEESLEHIGQMVATRAIAERRHIVTEIIGADEAPLEALANALHKCGYQVHLTYVQVDLATSVKRNAQRGPESISAYFTEEFQMRWLTSAARAASRGRGRAPAKGARKAKPKPGRAPRPTPQPPRRRSRGGAR